MSRKCRLAFNLLLVVVLTTGCASGDLAKIIEAAGKDTATVCVKHVIGTPYGTSVMNYARTNIADGNVACPADGGMSVKSDGAQVGIPITVTPQISIGQPTMPAAPGLGQRTAPLPNPVRR